MYLDVKFPELRTEAFQQFYLILVQLNLLLPNGLLNAKQPVMAGKQIMATLCLTLG